jgi:predicted ATPase/class 3 adenylate cyclase
VTFLFTDIEGSTRRWEADAEAMRSDLVRHDELVRRAVEDHRGVVFATGGDGFAVAFGRAGNALECAIEVRRTLAGCGLPAVRMAVHTGEAEERDGDYFGPAVNRVARLQAIGHGGQILVSHATEQLVRDHVSEGAVLVDRGLHRLRDLSSPERVFELQEFGATVDFPPLRSLDLLYTNLPVQLTSFVGREEDVKIVTEVLSDHRVVTLTGVGGVGKTRLALQVAADLLDVFRDGVWLVELAPVGEESRVVETIAAAIGVELPPGKAIESALLDALRSQAVLVVLDNCEHLLQETNRVVAMLARAAPKLAVLATSREPLGVEGEHTVALRSLDKESAVRLFRERAVAVDSSFVLGDAELGTVEHLCRRLDGMPLAIELAAARVRMFSPAELAVRLDQRFRLLTGGRGAVERHHTLRAAIDWSYDLLSENDRAVFERLSVFAGGCTLDAAQAVCGGGDVEDFIILDALASLIDKSLVVSEHSRAETRYGQLETIRQYAEEHLMVTGEADAVRERHARYYGAFTREAGRRLWGPDEVEWARRVEADLDNVRAAVSWAVAAGETDLAMRIASSLVTQAMERPIWATASIAEYAWRAPGADQHTLRSMVMGEASWAAVRRGEWQSAQALVDGALEAQRAGARFSASVWSYAMVHHSAWGDQEWARSLAMEALERAEAAGDVPGTIALRAAYAIGLMADQSTHARDQSERTLADARALGQPALIAMGLLAVGSTDLMEGYYERGLSRLRESVELSSEIGSSWQTIAGVASLAAGEAIYGDRVKAVELMRSILVSARDSGDTYYATGAAHVSATVFSRYNRHDLVARFDGALGAVEQGRAMGYGNWRFWYVDAVKEARTALGDGGYDELAAEGASIPSERILEDIIGELESLDPDHPTRSTT